MYKFTLNNNKKSKPIAKIKSGKYAGYIVYLLNEKDDNDDDDKIFSDFKSLTLKDGKFELIIEPPTEQRTVLTCFGQSGSGKTYLINDLIEQIIKNSDFHVNNYILFCKKPMELEKSFSDLTKKKLKQINLENENLVLNPLDLKNKEDIDMVRNSVIVMDDINTLSRADKFKKQLRENILSFRDDLLEVSRSYKTTILLTEHLSCNANSTKTILNESNVVVVYLGSGVGSYYRLLNFYLGLTKKQIDYLMKLPTRYIMFIRKIPMIYLTENMIGFISDI